MMTIVYVGVFFSAHYLWKLPPGPPNHANKQTAVSAPFGGLDDSLMYFWVQVVGNEGMSYRDYYGDSVGTTMGIHSRIPYAAPARNVEEPLR